MERYIRHLWLAIFFMAAAQAQAAGIITSSCYNISSYQLSRWAAFPQEWTTQVSLHPVIDANGYVRGYQIDWLAPQSRITDLGLKKGDEIIAVDGKSVYEIDEFMQRLTQLSTQKEFVLDVVEGKDLRTITYLVDSAVDCS